jgi:pentatricopeptide repeat protein
MKENDVKLDTIACAALMRAFNKGGQPGRVFSLAQSMREKDIPLSDTIFVEMVSACSL